MRVSMISCTEKPENKIEFAARNCYGSIDKSGTNPAFLRSLIKRGHFGILEHAHASFFVSGVSRACSHQFVRHRIFSYCQESQRFVTYEELPYVIPPSIEKDPEALRVYIDHMNRSLDCYKVLTGLGVPKEDARYVFPNAIETNIVVSGNFRALLEYFQQRLDKPAQWEIKLMSKEMWELLELTAPNVFARDSLENVVKRDYSILDAA